MDHKKDIGKVIKERLINTEVEPNTELWANIEKALDNKKKRRGGIIWWSAGIILFLGIFIGTYFFYDYNENIIKNDTINNPLVESESQTKNKGYDISKEQLKNNSEEAEVKTESLEESSTIEKTDFKNAQKNTKSKSKNNFSKSIKSIVRSNNNSKTKKEVLKNSTDLLTTTRGNRKEKVSNATLDTNTSTNEILLSKREPIETSSAKELLVDTDSINQVVKTKIKVAQSEEEVEKKKKITAKMFSISVQGGPNAYAYLSDGNPFKSSLSEGVLKSAYSYSYSALLNIPLNDKFIFRFGFRNSNFKNYVDQAVSNVSNNETLSILSNTAIKRNGIVITPALQTSIGSLNTFRIDQEINYQEIPLQFLYRIRDKKVKIDAILGISAMLITKNSITLSDKENSIVIGSGAYLKETSISSSIGMGFRYKLTERFTLDLEPTIQFQYGSFNKGYKNLHPVILNLSSGATFKL